VAHYYGDICNPLHTDQCDAEDAIHSPYETDAQDYTDSPGENSGWVRYDGYRATTNVVGFTKSTAGASHKQYSALVNGYAAGGMSGAVWGAGRRCSGGRGRRRHLDLELQRVTIIAMNRRAVRGS